MNHSSYILISVIMSYLYSIHGDSYEQNGCHASHVARVPSCDHTLHTLNASYARSHTSYAFEHLYKEKEGKHVDINRSTKKKIHSLVIKTLS